MLFRGIAVKRCNVGKCMRWPRKRPSPHKFLPLPWSVFPKQDFSALQETEYTHLLHRLHPKRRSLFCRNQPKGWLVTSLSLQGARPSRRQGAQHKTHFLGVEREPRAQTTDTPRTVAANENCCLKTQLPISQEHTKGNVQENGLAWKKIKIGCLVLNSNFPKLVG